MPIFHLYIDDSGSRYPDGPQAERSDGMDHFALGGFIVEEGKVANILAGHRTLVERWSISAPLHSTKIRGKRGPFSWLAKDTDESERFLTDLERFVLDLPIVGISSVIDRPGYVARYQERHPKPWLLCQTAFAILIERTAKYVRSKDGQLHIFFERSGKREDRVILQYMKSLKNEGMPFPGSKAAGYDSLSASEFRRVVLGDPQRVTKKVPMIQLADLVLYPIARGGYDPSYRPFQALHDSGRVIDALLEPSQVPTLGVKYSCFDTIRTR